MQNFVAFFSQIIPPVQEILIAGPLFLLWAFCGLWLAGWFKAKQGFKTGYTRKIFHFLIFASAAVIQTFSSLRVLCLFGAMVSLVIFFALVKGDGHALYEAIAREKDAPHRSYFIIVPYLATLVGGIVSNYYFSEMAIVGYLVTGLGDAIAEPVGTRFGRHEYSVPSFKGVKSSRSAEGSLAVFVASLVAIVLGLLLMGNPPVFSIMQLWRIAGLAMTCTVIEAVSPHGWDNATLQIVPAFLAYLIFA